VHRRRATVLALSFLTFSCVATAGAAPSARCEAVASASISESDQQALRAGVTRPPTLDIDSDAHHNDRLALDEMLRGTQATPLRWDRVPELVVMMPVMQYEKSKSTEYRATGEQLSEDEATELVSDLTKALVLLSDGAFRGFAAIRRETVAAGEIVNVMRRGQIVVARYNGVRDQLNTIGFGGRSTRGSTINAGSIILDADFDRAGPTRRLLRMHELGHALGYNHVVSRVSIMNPKIGPEPTDFDRVAARVAFQNFQEAAASCR